MMLLKSWQRGNPIRIPVVGQVKLTHYQDSHPAGNAERSTQEYENHCRFVGNGTVLTSDQGFRLEAVILFALRAWRMPVPHVILAALELWEAEDVMMYPLLCQLCSTLFLPRRLVNCTIVPHRTEEWHPRYGRQERIGDVTAFVR